MSLEIRVLFIANDTADDHHFICDRASRTLRHSGASLTFVNGVHKETGRKVHGAQYAQPVFILSYEAD